MINPLIKKFGYPRSRNNFVVAMLANNFYAGIDLSIGLRIGGFHTDDGTIQPNNKWGKLAGGHRLNAPHNFDINSSVYVVRDVIDTAFSIYNFKKKFIKNKMGDITFKEFTESKLDFVLWPFPGSKELKGMTPIGAIEEHHRRWKSTGIYIIDSDELYLYPIKSLRKIKNDLNLSCKHPFKVVKNLVGFVPYKGTVGNGRKELRKCD